MRIIDKIAVSACALALLTAFNASSQDLDKIDVRLDSVRKAVAAQKDSIDIHKREYNKAKLQKLKDSKQVLLDQVDAAEDSVMNLSESRTGKTRQLDSLRTAIAGMRVYEYEDNKSYLALVYSRMSEGRLLDIDESQNDFKDMDGFSEYRLRLESARRNFDLYHKGLEALQKPLDASGIKQIRDSLIYTLKLQAAPEDISKGILHVTQAQYNELDSLDIRLSRYPKGELALKQLVNDINGDEDVKRLRMEKNKEGCWKAIEIILNKNEAVYDRYFSLIPYLGDLLDEYIDELRENPLVPAEIEKRILE